MYSLEESFRTGTAMFCVVLFAATLESYRPAIERKLAEKLGRRMSNDEWLYLIRESFKRVQIDRDRERLRQRFQQLAGKKVIYEFVWNS